MQYKTALNLEGFPNTLGIPRNSVKNSEGTKSVEYPSTLELMRVIYEKEGELGAQLSGLDEIMANYWIANHKK